MSNTQESPRVQAARLRLEAANKRVFAASQASNAQAHYRQAQAPIYAGQSGVCMDKGLAIESYAARTRCEADLLDAQAAAILGGV